MKPPLKAASGDDSRETQLEAALRANAALRVQAEQLIAAYVAPESNGEAIINELIALFDGPQQREAQGLAAKALGDAARRSNSAPTEQGFPRRVVRLAGRAIR